MYKRQTRNLQKPASSGTYHWRVTDFGTANAEKAPLRPFKRMRTSAVNTSATRRRKTKSQVLYRRFSVATVKKIIFTDLNPLDYSIWDILQELVYEGRRELFANLKDLQNVIRDK